MQIASNAQLLIKACFALFLSTISVVLKQKTVETRNLLHATLQYVLWVIYKFYDFTDVGGGVNDFMTTVGPEDLLYCGI
jgi:hypothetical protein